MQIATLFRPLLVLLAVLPAFMPGAHAFAQTTPAGAGALSCVFDRLDANDRELIASSLLGGEPGDAVSKTAESKLNAATQACVTAHGWDRRRAGLSGAYAMNRAVYVVLEADFAAAGLSPGKLQAVWATLSEDDRKALRGDDLSDAVTKRLIDGLKTVGVPNNPDDLLEAYSSLTALAEVAAIEAAWAAPVSPAEPPGS